MKRGPCGDYLFEVKVVEFGVFLCPNFVFMACGNVIRRFWALGFSGLNLLGSRASAMRLRIMLSIADDFVRKGPLLGKFNWC